MALTPNRDDAVFDARAFFAAHLGASDLKTRFLRPGEKEESPGEKAERQKAWERRTYGAAFGEWVLPTSNIKASCKGRSGIASASLRLQGGQGMVAGSYDEGSGGDWSQSYEPVDHDPFDGDGNSLLSYMYFDMMMNGDPWDEDEYYNNGNDADSPQAAGGGAGRKPGERPRWNDANGFTGRERVDARTVDRLKECARLEGGKEKTPAEWRAERAGMWDKVAELEADGGPSAMAQAKEMRSQIRAMWIYSILPPELKAMVREAAETGRAPEGLAEKIQAALDARRQVHDVVKKAEKGEGGPARPVTPPAAATRPPSYEALGRPSGLRSMAALQGLIKSQCPPPPAMDMAEPAGPAMDFPPGAEGGQPAVAQQKIAAAPRTVLPGMKTGGF